MERGNTRQKILDAAQRLIEKGGFTRLTTKEIAKEAGCAEGTLFKHFERKEDLCLAVVLENSPTFKDVIASKRAGKGSINENLRDIALAAIRFSDRLIPLAASLFADAQLLMRHRDAIREKGGGPKDVFDLIAAYISDEQQLGRVRPDLIPLVASVSLLGPCFYWAFLRQGLGRNPLPMNDGDFAVSLASTLANGFTAPSRHSPVRPNKPRTKGKPS